MRFDFQVDGTTYPAPSLIPFPPCAGRVGGVWQVSVAADARSDRIITGVVENLEGEKGMIPVGVSLFRLRILPNRHIALALCRE